MYKIEFLLDFLNFDFIILRKNKSYKTFIQKHFILSIYDII